MILVTGARGVVGTPLLEKLNNSGSTVLAVSRSPTGVSGLQWDMQSPLDADAHAALSGLHSVVHCAPLWLLPPHLTQLHQSGMRRLVAFSSTSVVSKQQSSNKVEQDLVQRLSEAEAALNEFSETHNLATTLFRPSMVYGYGRDQNVMHLARFINRFKFALVAGGGQGLRQPVHADDLVAAVIFALDNPRTHGKTYNLAGGESLSYRAMLEKIFTGLGQKPRILSLPVGLFRALLKVAAKLGTFDYTPAMASRMQQDLVYEFDAAREDFGYMPRAFLQQPEQDLRGCR